MKKIFPFILLCLSLSTGQAKDTPRMGLSTTYPTQYGQWAEALLSGNGKTGTDHLLLSFSNPEKVLLILIGRGKIIRGLIQPEGLHQNFIIGFDKMLFQLFKLFLLLCDLLIHGKKRLKIPDFLFQSLYAALSVLDFTLHAPEIAAFPG